MSRHLSQTYIKWAGSSETAPRWLCPKKNPKKLLAFVGFFGGCFHHTSHTHSITCILHIYLYLPPHQNIPTKSLATILCLSLHAQPKITQTEKISKIGSVANVLDRRFFSLVAQVETFFLGGVKSKARKVKK